MSQPNTSANKKANSSLPSLAKLDACLKKLLVCPPPLPPDESCQARLIFQNIRSDGNCLYVTLLIALCNVSDRDITKKDLQT